MSEDPADLEHTEVEDPSPEEEVTPDTPDENDLGALKRALEREREERKQAKEELRRLREDEDHRRQWLTDMGYELDEVDPEDDPDFEDEYPDTDDSELEKRLAAIEAERAAERYERDLERQVGDRELDETGRDWIQFQTVKGGNNPDALKKAVTAWFDYLNGIEQAGVSRLRESKKAPRTPVRGKAATDIPDLDDKNARRAWMMEQIQARQQ